MGWQAVAELLASVGFGALSAVIPVANAEAYVIASQVTAVAGPVPVAVGVGVGQTIGKIMLFAGVRRGKDFSFVAHQRHRVRAGGPVRQRLRAWTEGLLHLVGTKRWGLPIVFLASLLGVPPLYAVALLAGATTMRLGWFAAVVLVGRVTRFVLVAYGVDVLLVK
ncbi:MAG TPA: hypothetical protein VFP89_00665 [Propionibacteriaceae bacterium]|nr:hypothetical protein [Propionibacteriaceae bacterium]